MHLLRNYEAQRRVVDFEIMRSGRQLQIRSRCISPGVGNNIFDLHRRPHVVSSEMNGIDHLQDMAIGEPQPAILSSCSAIKRRPSWLHSVKLVENTYLQ